jgi:NAD(P)-dependent dehydrogenase (short-subunit alcohol dehydrogenase family)
MFQTERSVLLNRSRPRLARGLGHSPGLPLTPGDHPDGTVALEVPEIRMPRTPSLKPVQDQVVVVMGASSGIGREAALRFARRGAKVVVSARTASALDTLVEQIRSDGGEAVAIAAEVAEPDQVKAVADFAATTYGRLDTWVHLPATAVWARVEDTTPEEFRRVVEVDLLGQVYGAMAALPHLKREGRGALVHVTSVVARRAFPLQAAYSAAKRGTEGFLEALRVELRHDGIPIRVSNVMPASIDTPFFEKARSKIGVLPKGPPPVYEPSVPAEALVWAAEHGPRDLVAGGMARGLMAVQAVSPRLLDAVLARVGFAVQRTKQADDGRDAVFEPIGGIDRVEGRIDTPAMRHSALTWMSTHKLVTAGLAAAGGGALTALRRARSSR